MPVTRFVAPGPLVEKTTPVLPVALAYPSAAWAACCSWQVSMWLISPQSYSASYINSAAPPGNPNTVSTPCSFKHSMMMFAPVNFTCPSSFKSSFLLRPLQDGRVLCLSVNKKGLRSLRRPCKLPSFLSPLLPPFAATATSLITAANNDDVNKGEDEYKIISRLHIHCVFLTFFLSYII